MQAKREAHTTWVIPRAQEQARGAASEASVDGWAGSARPGPEVIK